MKVTAEQKREARRLIVNAEDALDRALTSGERRDLVKDNTDWSSELVSAVVFVVEEAAGLYDEEPGRLQ